ncbi:unnamed protein product, partial [Vitis vinifera]|uniref:Uncharacterized protein n=1 Tax=Vitis vinifera TaxID=29760 RepID=D7TR14_VITVI
MSNPHRSSWLSVLD